MTEQRMEECLEYFRGRQVFQKVFSGFRKKYESLGHFGGTVTLKGLDAEEKAALGGFFQRDYTENQTITILASAMEKALSESRFGELAWEEILEAYFQEPLLARKEQDRREEKEKQQFFAEFLDPKGQEGKGTGNAGRQWLSHALDSHKDGGLLLMQQYREDREGFRETLKAVLAAIDVLPYCLRRTGKADGLFRERLPVFAAKTTGNPHYFDNGTSGEKLLTAFLCYDFQVNGKKENRDAEWKNRLYYQAGILKDDLSNDVLVYGIRGRKMGGELHQGIEGFYRERQAMRLTLNTIGTLKEAWAVNSPVFVLENPAVFSELVRCQPAITAVCGGGQPCLAVLALLDLLSEGSTLYYAGDFDPDGLLILQRLKERYGRRLVPWGYRREWYETYLSEVECSPLTMKKLDRVTLPEVQEIVERMKRHRKAAYQETMMKELADSAEILMKNRS